MTREEAMNVLKEHIDTYVTCHGEEDTVAVSLDNVDIEALDMAIKALEQEPFINKPCISEKQCEHDKNVVLDKIRAEIENDWQLKKFPCSPFSCGLRQAIEIIDKYKGEARE